jgi:hypothetical protein
MQRRVIIITNAVFNVGFQCGCQLRPPPRPFWPWVSADGAGALSFLAFGYVKSIFVVHVGCTRCVTSNTDHYMKIQARITLRVEFIRTCILLFLFHV